jgi:hypothetical protein
MRGGMLPHAGAAAAAAAAAAIQRADGRGSPKP